MIGKEIIESEPIPSSKVKQILEDFAENNELNYQQNLTLNHLARFKDIPLKTQKKYIKNFKMNLV